MGNSIKVKSTINSSIANKRKVDIELGDNKKKKLQEEFLKKHKTQVKLSEQEINVEEDNKDYKQLYKNIKNNYDKLQKEKDNLKQELLIHKQDNKSLSKEIERLKQEIFNERKEKYQLKNEIDNFSNVKDGFKEDTEQLNIIIDEKDKKQNRLEKEIDFYKSKIKNLTEIAKHINEFGRLRNRDIEEITSLKVKNKGLQKRTQLLSDEIKELKEMINNYQNESPKVLIENLYERMVLDNIFDYTLANQLVRKYKILKRKFHDIKKGKTYWYDYDKTLYGYLLKQDEIFLFIDIYGNKHDINHLPEINKSDGDPASAFDNEDGSVDIFWIYETESEMLKDVKIKKKSYEKLVSIDENNIIETKSIQEYEFIGEFKVLIITSVNGVRYRNRLENHGIIANWIDPFEKSPVHVRNQMLSNDIVLMCVEAMSHYVLDFVEENNEKFQFITNHNEDVIVSRTRYAAKQLGLIQ